MILRYINRIRWPALLLTGMVLGLSLVAMYLRLASIVPPEVSLYVVQPLIGVLMAIATYTLTKGTKDRAHRQVEKAYIVGSVVAMWFVVYFLSGLATTYVHNTLTNSLAAIFLNLFTYMSVALAMEYTRYRVMQIAGRRNVVWFGIVVTLVFTLTQINITSLMAIATAEQFLKLSVSDIVPALVSSMLLTYLAVGAGLPAMLVYRLSVLAITILLPIIPKYDWYMIGISAVLLALAVYLVIDKGQQGRQAKYRRHHFHIDRASNIMFVFVMIGIVLFMTGALQYKPVVIVSNSMQPVYNRGSVVVVRLWVDPMDIKSGDIIQYKHKQSGDMITHRVVDIQQSGDGSGQRVFITKGDNNQSKDPPVRVSQVTGIIMTEVPYIGYPTIWLRTLL